MFDLDFESSSPQFPCHPRHRDAALRVLKELDYLKDHFFVFSSGTTSSDLKGYALSKDALFTNARAVNEHFNLTSKDIWGLSIPYFHVGGLSVLARAYVLGSKIVDLGAWNPMGWAQKLSSEHVSITTVVPTQVFDLVRLSIMAPTELKHLVVGGDYLSQELEKRAMDLGWPIIRTFGMTEVCSQLASAKTAGGKLKILPIHQAELGADGRLLIKSRSLFTLQFKLKGQLELTWAQDLCDSKGRYITNDLAELDTNSLRPLGRLDDQVNVSGRLVAIHSLKEILYSYALNHGLYQKVELTLEEDERQGKALVVLHLDEVVVLPEDLFSPLKFTMKKVATWERTDLGKLKKI
jgi:O-succinylbenzoic acid--CoA ligase